MNVPCQLWAELCSCMCHLSVALWLRRWPRGAWPRCGQRNGHQARLGGQGPVSCVAWPRLWTLVWERVQGWKAGAAAAVSQSREGRGWPGPGPAPPALPAAGGDTKGSSELRPLRCGRTNAAPAELQGKVLALARGWAGASGRKSTCSSGPAAGRSSNCWGRETLAKGLRGRAPGNGFPLPEGRLRWDVGQQWFPGRALRAWHRLAREAAAAPASLQVSQAGSAIGASCPGGLGWAGAAEGGMGSG